MPKKLNISSNERVDLDDFNRVSSSYTQESDNFDRQKLLLSGRSLISSGFRIEISDQATSPGEFTIYNGVAVDKSGNLLNNEQQVSDARTLTLSGAGLDFYVEVEFIESESDVDSRAFWDPTFSGNNPPGKEFSLNVATRLTPDWQVVQPISTSDFDTVTTGANSTKIPIAVLTTNGSNEITGFTAVNASTVLEEDAGATDLTLRVVDSTIFPISGTFTVGGTSVNVTGNDRANGILTISPAMGVTKQAGDIVVEAGGVTAAFVPQSGIAAPPTGNTGDTDRRRRLFAGDEIRGSAMSADPEDAALRADVNVASLKDYVDFLAAQLREVKYGNSRTGETSTSVADLSVVTSSRYYDYAGNVGGARSWTFTVGDTIASLGDFNAASSDLGTQLQAAHDALDAAEGGSILVKEGDYVWDSTVTINRPIVIAFAEGVSFVAGTYSSSPITIADGVRVELIGMPPVPASELPFYVTAANVDGIELAGVNSTLQVDFTTATSVANSSFDFRGCTFPAESSAGAFKTNNGTTQFFSKMSFKECLFQHNDSADLTTEAIVDVQLSNSVFEDCIFDLAVGAGSANQLINVNDVDNDTGTNVFSRCKFIESNSGAGKAKGPIQIVHTSSDEVIFEDCHFEVTWAATTSSDIERSFVYGVALKFINCKFDNFDVPDSAVTSTSTYGACIRSPLDSGRVKIEGSSFTSSDTSSFNAAYVGTGSTQLHVSSSIFNSFYRSLFVSTADSLVVNNSEFANQLNDLTFTEVVPIEFSVFSNTDRGARVTGNSFEWTSTTVASTFTYTAIKANDSDTFNSPTIIQNNTIVMRPNTGQAVGINLSENGKILGRGRVIVTGNDITIPNEAWAGSTSSYWGIKSDATGSLFQTAFDWNISNNNISIAGNTSSGSGNAYGIYILGPDSYETSTINTSGFVISNNVINVQAPDTGNCTGINFTGVYGNISGNNITTRNGNSATLSAGILGLGHWINATGNIIQTRDICSGIYISIGDDTNLTALPGNINVSTNNIYSSATTSGSPISVIASAASSNAKNINICNNIIRARHGTTNSNALLNFGSSTGGGSLVICGNSIFEDGAPATGSVRTGINVIITAVVFVGVTINSNNITSSNVSSLRSITNSGAILVLGSDFLNGLSCSGNVVQGWVGNGIANRRSIDINDVVRFSVTGNVCDLTGVAGEPVIRVNSSTQGCVAANDVTTGNILTSTSTGVVTNGDNNGTII